MPPKKNDEYEVEEILEVKVKGRGKEWLVKWEGYDEPTWEPTRNLTNCPELIKQFEEKQKKKEEKKESPLSRSDSGTSGSSSRKRSAASPEPGGRAWNMDFSVGSLKVYKRKRGVASKKSPSPEKKPGGHQGGKAKENGVGPSDPAGDKAESDSESEGEGKGGKSPTRQLAKRFDSGGNVSQPGKKSPGGDANWKVAAAAMTAELDDLFGPDVSPPRGQKGAATSGKLPVNRSDSGTSGSSSRKRSAASPDRGAKASARQVRSVKVEKRGVAAEKSASPEKKSRGHQGGKAKENGVGPSGPAGDKADANESDSEGEGKGGKSPTRQMAKRSDSGGNVSQPGKKSPGGDANWKVAAAAMTAELDDLFGPDVSPPRGQKGAATSGKVPVKKSHGGKKFTSIESKSSAGGSESSSDEDEETNSPTLRSQAGPSGKADKKSPTAKPAKRGGKK